MQSFPNENKRKYFWTFHISIWVIHWGFNQLVFYWEKIGDIKSMFLLFISALSGFTITLFLRRVYRSFDYSNRSILSIFSMAALYTLLFAHFWIVIELALYAFFYQTTFLNSQLTFSAYLIKLYFMMYILVGWSAIYIGAKFWENWNLQITQTEKESRIAKSAQLEMLRYQLNPHFFFNALCSLRALIRIDSERAEKMISKISEFLRYTLTKDASENVQLKEEIDALNDYFDVEKERFGENLIVKYNLSPESLNFEIPCFLLNPIVENSIKHGMDSGNVPLKILIETNVSNNTLQIIIENNGAWIDEKSDCKTSGTNTGLKNVKERLDFSFPNKNSFIIEKLDNSVKIKITITR